MWELLVLAERGRIKLAPGPREWIATALNRTPAHEAPLNHEVALRSREILPAHEDPADRFLDRSRRTMPLPNGVNPWGRIEATCPSAEWLGNRGILHDEHGAITRAWANKAWITCALSFKGRNRKPLMQPGRYSELFFLDEATALAAGHRPCGECRRERHDAFKAAWFAANDPAGKSISGIDRVLHFDRLTAERGKRTFRVPLADLPVGTIVEHDGDPYLLWRSGWVRWTPKGYEAPSVTPPAVVEVLTPRSIVAMLRTGFSPQVHPSAAREAESGGGAESA